MHLAMKLFAVTLNTNEWFGIEINYNPFTVINGQDANQFELNFDVFGIIILKEQHMCQQIILHLRYSSI